MIESLIKLLYFTQSLTVSIWSGDVWAEQRDQPGGKGQIWDKIQILPMIPGSCIITASRCSCCGDVWCPLKGNLGTGSISSCKALHWSTISSYIIHVHTSRHWPSQPLNLLAPVSWACSNNIKSVCWCEMLQPHGLFLLLFRACQQTTAGGSSRLQERLVLRLGVRAPPAAHPIICQLVETPLSYFHRSPKLLLQFPAGCWLSFLLSSLMVPPQHWIRLNEVYTLTRPLQNLERSRTLEPLEIIEQRSIELNTNKINGTVTKRKWKPTWLILQSVANQNLKLNIDQISVFDSIYLKYSIIRHH